MISQLRLFKNYIIIAIVSLICLFFLPFTSSTVGMGFNVPDTVAGWVVYVANKLIVAAVNLLIFYCFCQQGKLNVKEDPRHIEANEILLKVTDERQYKPKSPRQHNVEVYGGRGMTIFLTSILGTVSLTQAVLSFDWVTMLTYIFVITSGIIFGLIQMSIEEHYWTVEYLRYAKIIQSKQKGDYNVCL
jgi:hypothetical protein